MRRGHQRALPRGRAPLVRPVRAAHAAGARRRGGRRARASSSWSRVPGRAVSPAPPAVAAFASTATACACSSSRAARARVSSPSSGVADTLDACRPARQRLPARRRARARCSSAAASARRRCSSSPTSCAPAACRSPPPSAFATTRQARLAGAFAIDDLWVATDDGSVGRRGTAVELAREVGAGPQASVLACGPAAMIAAVQRLDAPRRACGLRLARGPHGLRHRLLPRLRRRHRARLPARLRRGPGVRARRGDARLTATGRAEPRRREAPTTDGARPGRDARRLRLEHPLLNASGTFDAARDGAPLRRRLLTPTSLRRLRAQDGHARGRAPATRRRASPRPPSGMINAVGLENPGDRGLARRACRAGRARACRSSSASAATGRSTTLAVVRRARGAVWRPRRRTPAAHRRLRAQRLVSERREGGLRSAPTRPRPARLVGRRARRSPRRLLIVKLTPNVTDVVAVARAAAEAGADARVARQHAARRWCSTADAQAVPRQPHRRPLRAGHQADRAAHGRGGGRALSTCRSSAWAAS